MNKLYYQQQEYCNIINISQLPNNGWGGGILSLLKHPTNSDKSHLNQQLGGLKSNELPYWNPPPPSHKFIKQYSYLFRLIDLVAVVRYYLSSCSR